MEDDSGSQRISLRSPLMSPSRIFERSVTVPSDSDNDRSDDEIYLPMQYPDTHPSSIAHVPSIRAATETEASINQLGNRLDRMHLAPLESKNDHSMLTRLMTRCDLQLSHTPDTPSGHNTQSNANADAIITNDDVLVFQSTMASIKDDMDPQIGSLKPHDIACLNHGRLLNDEIINAFMQLLQHHPTSISCHFFNSFFLPKLLSSYNYQNLKAWTSTKRLKRWGQNRECILDVDVLFFPYFAFVHWSLIVVDLRDDSITLYDSMMPVSKRPKGHVKEAMDGIVRYLMDEAQDKKQQDWSERVFSFSVASDGPQQENGSDCGVFLIQYAKCLSMDMSLSFSQAQMYDYRIQMLRELLHDRIFCR